MDPTGGLVEDVLSQFEEFDKLRHERLSIAQEFVAKYNDISELFVDVANILMLAFAAQRMSRVPKGFKSDST